MNKIILLITLFIVIPITSAGGVDSVESQSLLETSKKGQSLIFARKYDQAIVYFKDLENKFPNSPIGLFGQMATYETQMLEQENFSFEKEFLELAEKGEKVISKVMQQYNPSEIDLFYSGALIGLDGFFYARKGKWWPAYLKGNKSRQIFRSILKKNPNFIDAKLGTGMYIYWRSVFTKEVSFLPFFSDKRKQGISIVQEVATKGVLANEMAKINLGVMFFEEKRFKESLEIFRDYIKQYPKSVIFHYLASKALVAAKRYEESVKESEQILKIDPNLQKPKYFIGMAVALDKDKAQFDYGIKHLKEFLEKNKQRLWRSYSYYWLGVINEKKGDKKKAIENYEKAYELNKGLKRAKIKIRGLGGGI